MRIGVRQNITWHALIFIVGGPFRQGRSHAAAADEGLKTGSEEIIGTALRVYRSC